MYLIVIDLIAMASDLLAMEQWLPFNNGPH